MNLWQTIICLISKQCNMFKGDRFTDYLDAQRRASEEAQIELFRKQRKIDDEFFPPKSKRRGVGHAE